LEAQNSRFQGLEAQNSEQNEEQKDLKERFDKSEGIIGGV